MFTSKISSVSNQLKICNSDAENKFVRKSSRIGHLHIYYITPRFRNKPVGCGIPSRSLLIFGNLKEGNLIFSGYYQTSSVRGLSSTSGWFENLPGPNRWDSVTTKCPGSRTSKWPTELLTVHIEFDCIEPHIYPWRFIHSICQQFVRLVMST